MTYSATVAGGHVHITEQDEPVVRNLKEKHGNALFEVLDVEYARFPETYPIYHIRKVGTTNPVLSINGRFLDDALETIEDRLRACAVNALSVYMEYMEQRGQTVDLNALLRDNGVNT